MNVRYKDIRDLENGAQFHTVDLHIHSYQGSSDVRDTAMTPEAIVEFALAEHLAVIAITDHNNDGNVMRAIEAAAPHASQLLVVPGTEVTTPQGHLLAYFPPDQAAALNDFLSKLDLRGRRGAQETRTSMSMAMVVAEAEQMGGFCIAAHIDTKKGFEASAGGYPAWKEDILLSSGLYGLEVVQSEHLNWYTLSDEATPAGNERKKIYRTRTAQKATSPRSVLAVVQNSDAHSLQDLRDTLQNRALTRLKMTSLSFDAVRTALVDPQARVRTMATIPESFPRLLGVDIVGGFNDGLRLRLSDNLTTIIGGRGSGKSTVIQTLAYALGANRTLEQRDSCPDTAVVYCKDEHDIIYRYRRHRFQEPLVQAVEHREIANVPVGAFEVEYYAQGELSDVARDPLGQPELLQEFLDRHLNLADLIEEEKKLLIQLEQNTAQLVPLEREFERLRTLRRSHRDANTKIEIAEKGRLKEIAAIKNRLTAERALLDSLKKAAADYKRGLSLSTLRRDYDAMAKAAGVDVENADNQEQLEEAKRYIASVNEFLGSEEKVINRRLREIAAPLEAILAAVDERHKEVDEHVADRVAHFQKQGLSGDLTGLSAVLKERRDLTARIEAIQARRGALDAAREERLSLLSNLWELREEVQNRRKHQVRRVNQSLKRLIPGYHIALRYDPAGVYGAFLKVILEAMHGT